MSIAPAAAGKAAPGLAVQAEDHGAVERQFLGFHLAGQLFGVPLAQVAEITPFKTLNQIPHMPKSVEGLLDLRGQVIPVISLRTRMLMTGMTWPRRSSRPSTLLGMWGIWLRSRWGVISATWPRGTA